tara:strand:+ start:219 stop:554 length:336 start_codon:yes stop_codon:yes gene_type:complete
MSERLKKRLRGGVPHIAKTVENSKKTKRDFDETKGIAPFPSKNLYARPKALRDSRNFVGLDGLAPPVQKPKNKNILDKAMDLFKKINETEPFPSINKYNKPLPRGFSKIKK